MATGPAYMNSTPHHSKVRALLTLSSALFVAGEDITGKVEVECKAEKEVGIGVIMVELFAIQELNSRDHSATSTFIHSRRLFQGHDLPPSNAVHAHPTLGDPPLPPSYFPARRGITTFFFKFSIPASSPSSISFASGLAKIRYEIRASVGVVYRSEKRLVTSSVDADVVQSEDMADTVDEHVIIGENGKMYVRGKILGGRLVAGEQACLELQVKNHTPKKTTGLSLTLLRNLRLHGAASNVPVQLSDTLFSETFRGTEYTMQPGTEGVANLVFKVPNAARVVKGGIRDGSVDGVGGRKHTEPLFEIRCILGVKINMGLGSKEVVFEMPVQLSHRAALADAAPDLELYYPSPYETEPVYDYHDPRATSPLSPPNPHFSHPTGSGNSSPAFLYGSTPTSPSPYYQSPTPPQHPVYVSPPHGQRFWSPPPQIMTPLPYSLTNPNQLYYYPPPPVGLIPFAYPTRPSSAGAHPAYHVPSQVTGLPDTHDQLFLPPAHVTENQAPITVVQNIPPADAGPEEGKGERASRISQHLHKPTRARSMSPTSHRFPVPPPVPPAFTHSTPQRLHATSPRHAPPVLSPRPVVSPGRKSYIAESPAGANIGNGTTRSDRVDLLERLVDPGLDDEGKSVEDVLKDVEMAEKTENKERNVSTELVADKTLPGPPVPSRKVQPKSKSKNGGLPRAMDVFGEMFLANEPRDVVKATDQPANSVLRPSPMPKRVNTGDKGGIAPRPQLDDHGLVAPVSGLDALERRLVKEVGTRKPETSQRPNIFSLGFTLTSKRNNSSDSASAPPPLTPMKLRDSEMSDLALSASQKSPASPQPATTGDVAPVSAKDDNVKEQEVHKLRKEAKGRVADWLNRLDVPSDSVLSGGMSSASEPVRRRKHSRAEEGLASSGTSGTSPEPTNARRTPSPLRTPTVTAVFNTASRSDETSADKIPVIPAKAITTKASSPPHQPLSNGDARSKGERPNNSGSILELSTSPAKASPALSLKQSDLPPSNRVNKPGLYTSPCLPSRMASPASPASPSKSPVLPSRSPQLKGILPPTLDELAEVKLRSPPVSPSPAVPEINKAMRRLELPSSNDASPGSKYDVRSARGGKGGIATSVAAIWTSIAEENNSKEMNFGPAAHKPINKKAANTPFSAAPAKRPAVLDIGKSKPSPSAESSPISAAAAAVDSAPPARAAAATTTHESQEKPRNNPIKSASAPATVVPSHAKPQLSSTASLARPITMSPSAAAARVKPPPCLSPTLEEEATVVMSTEEEGPARRIIPSRSPPPPPPPLRREMAFGQARLKDLIKKYQQAATSS